ncbi:MAG: cytochrome b/b6 domain-containing protein [Gammaproteobacteria bacterium]
MKTAENTVLVWDPLVRIGHWTLVIAFFTAYFTEDEFLTQHVWAGYVVGIVVCIRLLWGFVGTQHARFSDFARSPATVIWYLRDHMANRARPYVGHNPAGGAMIVLLLIGLAGTVFSGLVLYAIEEDAGPLAGWVAENTSVPALPALISNANANGDEREGGKEHEGDAREAFWEELHEIFTNVTLVLIAFHVAGVLFSSYVDKENLIWAMVTGRKRHGPKARSQE